MDIKKLQKLATLLRYWALRMTTKAGSGHPTSSLSAADLMAVFLSEVFRFDFDRPDNPNNDRMIFSKGHATPLYYALFALAGAIKTEELDNYRKFGSTLEGHPTPRFPFTEAATGSLGQGLSIGLGEALALKRLFPKLPRLLRSPKDLPRVFVLLGDGEMAEGSVWEAINIASHYKLDNLVAILDVNRLGQSGETILKWDIKTYQRRFEAFAWETRVIDGHDFNQIADAFEQRTKKPFAIIAKTIKGKGVSFLEDKNGWHGKALSQEQLEQAVRELGKVELNLRVKVGKPFSFVIPSEARNLAKRSLRSPDPSTRSTGSLARDDSGSSVYDLCDQVATRKAYGTAITRLGEVYPDLVALDGDVKNSTFSEIFKEKFPDRFYEMYIAEQNMVGSAVGLARMGFIPFVSTFACFLTRAFDQIRMAAISGANIKFCGSHAGVSIGEDGASQMGLEDLSMFRSVFGSTVLCPADAVSAQKLVEEMIITKGISYLRVARPATAVIYKNSEEFLIGGSKIHKLPKSLQLLKQKVIIIAAGITLYEALKAQEILAKENIEAIVVDCYSIKPIDSKTLLSLASSLARSHLARQATVSVITVEDHWFDGGLGDAVLNVFANHDSIRDRNIRIHKLAVTKMPKSGKPQELLDYEGISASAIVKKVREVIK